MLHSNLRNIIGIRCPNSIVAYSYLTLDWSSHIGHILYHYLISSFVTSISSYIIMCHRCSVTHTTIPAHSDCSDSLSSLFWTFSVPSHHFHVVTDTYFPLIFTHLFFWLLFPSLFLFFSLNFSLGDEREEDVSRVLILRKTIIQSRSFAFIPDFQVILNQKNRNWKLNIFLVEGSKKQW